MPETYKIVFHKAGDGSPTAVQAVAEKIASATKSPLDKILKQVQSTPFVYRRGLPKTKAEAISATLNKFGALTEVIAEEEAAATPGFDLGAAAAPSRPAPATPASSGGFDFGSLGASAPGGFDLASPAPAGSGERNAASEDFSIESLGADESAPARPAAPGGFGGFEFTAEAAVSAAPDAAAPARNGGLEIERNVDFGASAAARAAAPPRQKKPSVQETMTCPRCGNEQPPAAECASCGVVMSKAGASEAPSAPVRRPRATARARKDKTRLAPAAIGALVVVAAVAAAWLGGAFNPLLLKLAVGGDPVLKKYSVSLAPPAAKNQRFVAAVLGTAAAADELRSEIVERCRRIEDEISRLGSLTSLGEFEQGVQGLQAELEAYRAHEARRLPERIRNLASRYYPNVLAAGVDVDGITYFVSPYLEQARASGFPQAEPLVDPETVDGQIAAARERVRQQEARRVAEERQRTINVSLRDGFDSGLDPRWQHSGEGLALAAGRVRLTAQPAPISASPLLLVYEPATDYDAEVTVSGAVADSSRGALVVIEEGGGFVGVAKTRGRGGEIVLVANQAGDGNSTAASRDVRLRIEKRGPYYLLLAWNPNRGDWARLDRIQPSWGSAPRRLGFATYNGSATFEFDDFALQVR